jgi:hypothetical protein
MNTVLLIAALTLIAAVLLVIAILHARDAQPCPGVHDEVPGETCPLCGRVGLKEDC